MKFSILMPTYNDSDTIVETLNSIKAQTYTNWELIIINDGSSDSTEKVIQDYIAENKLEDKIKYIYQTNADQLNALKNGSKHITGDYVYILHSDDIFTNNTSLERANSLIKTKENYDAIIGSPLIINDKSEVTGKQQVKKYINKPSTIVTQLLFLGRNLFIDFAFFKKEAFLTKVAENYLTWNSPFWLNVYNASILNVYVTKESFFDYRVYDGNYANNEIGTLNLTNGELRVATSLLKHFNIPCYKLQYYIYRIFCKLHIDSIYKPIYLRKTFKNKYQYIVNLLNKRYDNNAWQKYDLFNSVVGFYKSNNKREIILDKIPENEFIYMGKDMRKFNKAMVTNSLTPFYKNLLNEMKLGFNKIVLKNKEDYNNIVYILKFLCIYPFVEII